MHAVGHDVLARLSATTSAASAASPGRVARREPLTGKQDLFVPAPGGQPQALTDFEVDSDLPLSVADRRVGIVSAQGGDVAWVPAVGNVTGMQWTADNALVYQEISPDGKTREIKSASVGTLPRILWRDRDERW